MWIDFVFPHPQRLSEDKHIIWNWQRRWLHNSSGTMQLAQIYWSAATPNPYTKGRGFRVKANGVIWVFHRLSYGFKTFIDNRGSKSNIHRVAKYFYAWH
jgi:hypothetical protein